jgi:hypothetical protein
LGSRLAPIVENMVKTSLRCFRHVEKRRVDIVRKVDQMEDGQIIRDIGRPRKIIRETITKI